MIDILKIIAPFVAPQKVLVDFEQAAVNAYTSGFPQAHIKGCFFHLSQSILRKVNSLGHKQSYENVLNFHVQVKCLSALSFVPIGDIPAVFSQLADTFPDDNASHALLQHICWGHRSWQQEDCQCLVRCCGIISMMPCFRHAKQLIAVKVSITHSKQCFSVNIPLCGNCLMVY